MFRIADPDRSPEPLFARLVEAWSIVATLASLALLKWVTLL